MGMRISGSVVWRPLVRLGRKAWLAGFTVLLLACEASNDAALAGEDTFDHSAWDAILEASVTEAGWVNYKQVKAKYADLLGRYLKALGDANVDKLKSREEKMAFWINAYNAICLQKILDNDIPDSVPRALLFGTNIFKERTYRVGGKIRSLDDIEHGILRKTFKDPRVHSALVCAASSCPRLRSESYTGARLNDQLDKEARHWVQVGKDKSGERKNYLNRPKNVYYASKIFEWFQEDFGDSDAGVLAFLKRHGSKEDAEFLDKNKVQVRYLTYIWKVNSQ